jgi:hypothetical protein
MIEVVPRQPLFSRAVCITISCIVLGIGTCTYAVHVAAPDIERANQRIDAAAKASELAACEKAGLKTPRWRVYGPSLGEREFYCADETGRLHLVLEPDCNTHVTSNCK